MRCEDGVWSSIYDSWLEAKANNDPDHDNGPIKTGDRQIDELEAQFYKKYALKES
jgi:hypothetical protein